MKNQQETKSYNNTIVLNVCDLWTMVEALALSKSDLENEVYLIISDFFRRRPTDHLCVHLVCTWLVDIFIFYDLFYKFFEIMNGSLEFPTIFNPDMVDHFKQFITDAPASR